MLRCSFCGKPADQTGALLAGPEVNICDHCITVGVRTIETRDALEQSAPGAPVLFAAEDELLLSQMAATSERVDQERARLKAQVGELRRRGTRWHVIGAALGVSQQIAEQRFGA